MPGCNGDRDLSRRMEIRTMPKPSSSGEPMGKIKVRYLIERRRRKGGVTRYWWPIPKLQQAGFQPRRLDDDPHQAGDDEHGGRHPSTAGVARSAGRDATAVDSDGCVGKYRAPVPGVRLSAHVRRDQGRGRVAARPAISRSAADPGNSAGCGGLHGRPDQVHHRAPDARGAAGLRAAGRHVCQARDGAATTGAAEHELNAFDFSFNSGRS
jgi:hypothetical protein